MFFWGLQIAVFAWGIKDVTGTRKGKVNHRKIPKERHVRHEVNLKEYQRINSIFGE